jgi:hypothetical protein
MSLEKRTTGWSVIAMFAFAFLLVVTGVSTSHAQQVLDPSKNTEDFDGGQQGDPDMPTGDVPPPSGTGGSTGSEGGAYRGHAYAGGITETVPTKRWGAWAHWKVALKLFARNLAFVR